MGAHFLDSADFSFDSCPIWRKIFRVKPVSASRWHCFGVNHCAVLSRAT